MKGLLSIGLICLTVTSVHGAPAARPVDVAISADGQRLYVAMAQTSQIRTLDTQTGRTLSVWSLPRTPSGMVLQGNRLWVTSSSDQDPKGTLYSLNAQTGGIVAQTTAGAGAYRPRLSPDGSKLVVLSRWDTTVSVYQTDNLMLVALLPVLREPSACDFTPNGQQLWVANLLPVGRSDAAHVAAAVSVFSTRTWTKIKDIDLPNGTSSVTGLRVSADGVCAYVIHNAAAFQLPTNRLVMGWQNASSLTVLDVASLSVVTSAVLDDVEVGAANPSDLELTPDGGTLVIAHAGTQEVSLIDEQDFRDTFWRNTKGQPVTPVKGVYYAIQSHSSGKVMQVAGAATTDGATIQQGTYVEGAHQQFMLQDGPGGTLYIMARAAQKLLHVTGDSLADVTKIEIRQVPSAGSQFTLASAGEPYYFITGSNSGKVLDVEGNSMADGANIIQYTRHGGSNQQWAFIPVADQVVFTDITGDFTALLKARKRIQLAGNGPRALAVTQDKVFALEYFTESISVVNLKPGYEQQVVQWPLTASLELTQAQQGEKNFCDATWCFQHWQSCASCHPGARSDGLNWDLANDGMGNDKNSRSMVHSFDISPVMSTGVRANASIAVLAGFHYIEFVDVPSDVTDSVNAYLQGLQPVPSPYLIGGQLSDSARRGQVLFNAQGCATCHAPPYYSDQKKHVMGTLGPRDTGVYDGNWVTPTLVECWRTAPYLHDGRCATMKDVFTQEQHGQVAGLTDEAIDDLVAFVLSL